MEALILEKCERIRWYTDLVEVFDGLAGRHLAFDWLITDLECQLVPELRVHEEARILSGFELDRLVRERPEPIQFIWGVFTGFSRGGAPPVDELAVVPVADGNPDFWHGQPSIQYPGAIVELVAWDSSATLLITGDADLAAAFKRAFPECRKL